MNINTFLLASIVLLSAPTIVVRAQNPPCYLCGGDTTATYLFPDKVIPLEGQTVTCGDLFEIAVGGAVPVADCAEASASVELQIFCGCSNLAPAAVPVVTPTAPVAVPVPVAVPIPVAVPVPVVPTAPVATTAPVPTATTAPLATTTTAPVAPTVPVATTAPVPSAVITESPVAAEPSTSPPTDCKKKKKKKKGMMGKGKGKGEEDIEYYECPKSKKGGMMGKGSGEGKGERI